MRKILSLFILFCFMIPLVVDSIPKSKGRTYAPEEGTFDRRKRIVIQPKCRLLVKEKSPVMLYVLINLRKEGIKIKKSTLVHPEIRVRKK